MQDVVFVVNPRAASGRAGKVWHDLRDQISQVRQARYVDAVNPQEARQRLIELLDDRVRRVVAIGGTVPSIMRPIFYSTGDVPRPWGWCRWGAARIRRVACAWWQSRKRRWSGRSALRRGRWM
ncbi:hypothetical protein [Alkalilimnicola ehrlichii]|uniref:hypothetical protein n=1 Tax=Alkalilimnicola ehrlichii TaxID=351052 RepID=UPI001C6E6117|nr:hypothetical protein [Alkalilimnicola ehrlichii]